MPRETPAERLRLAMAMQREGTELMRRNLRRRHPYASEAELTALVDRWLLSREPDAPGHPVSWPRRIRLERPSRLPPPPRAASDLTDLGARFALVGGLAVSVWSEPRFTRDVDLVVGVEVDREAERLVHELSGRRYEVVTIIEQTRTHRLATARLRRADDRSVFIDLLFASSGIERELADAAVSVDGLPVASVGHLIALKVLSESDRRLQDRLDIDALAKVATDEDWRTAEAMVRLIEERGFHWGRALLTRLRRWRRRAEI